MEARPISASSTAEMSQKKETSILPSFIAKLWKKIQDCTSFFSTAKTFEGGENIKSTISTKRTSEGEESPTSSRSTVNGSEEGYQSPVQPSPKKTIEEEENTSGYPTSNTLDDDEKSTSGSSSGDSTSTYMYSHEAYDSFQHKVILLAHSLGDFEEVSLQRQRGGSFNRVVIARLRKRNGEAFAGAFRIPRFVDFKDEDGDSKDEDGDHKQRTGDTPRVASEILDQVAVLQHLSLEKISAPKLLAFDATGDNSVGLPFVLQEYADGVALSTLYDNMSLEDKFDVVDAVVEFLISSERTRFSGTGTLGAAENPDTLTKESCFSDTPLRNVPMTIRAFECVEEQQLSSLPDLLSCQLQARHKIDLERCDGWDELTTMWRRLQDMLAEMKAKGFFECQIGTSMSLSDSVLFHWDLAPRNIIMKPTGPGGRWSIDKVIDWDKPLAVPPVLARKPPVWLWDFSDDVGNTSNPSDYDGDMDLLPTFRYDADSGRLSTGDQQIRARFEDRFTRGLQDVYEDYNADVYQDEAYGKGRWIRRLARFAMDGVDRDQDLKRFDHLSKEWSEHFPRSDS